MYQGEISSGLAASLAIDDDDESFESPLSDKDLGDLEASLQAIEFQDRVAHDRNQRRVGICFCVVNGCLFVCLFAAL